MMTWTPREDAALLRIKAKQRVLQTPALQQSQWQDVAFDVAEAADASVRSADECEERYKALLEAAKDTEKIDLPSGDRTLELVHVALEREAAVDAGAGSTASAEAKENQPPTNGLQNGPQSVATTAASTPLTGTANVSTAVAPSASVAMAVRVNPRKRPQGYEPPKALTRQHDEIILRVVAETGMTRVSEAWLWVKTARHVTIETMSDVPPKVCKDRYNALLQMNDEELEARFEGSREMLDLLNSGRSRRSQLLIQQWPDQAKTHRQPSVLSTAKPSRGNTLETPRPQPTQGSVEEAMHTEVNGIAPRELTDPRDGTEETEVPQRREDDMQMASGGEEQQAPQDYTEEIAELKKLVAWTTARLTRLSADLSNARIESETQRRQLTQTNCELADARAEIAGLHVEISSLKLANQLSMPPPSAHCPAHLTQGQDDTSGHRDDSSRRLNASASQGKSAQFENEQRAQWEELSSGFMVQVESVREAQKENADTLNQLSTRLEANTTTERQRHAIFFEMIENETLKREELVVQLNKHEARYQQDQHDQAVCLEKRRALQERDQQAREESIVWFQEEIRQELGRIQDEVKQDLSKHEQRLVAVQDQLLSGLEELQAATNKQYDEAKCHTLDQHVHTTLKLHELRNAIERERQERSNEFTALLHNIQRLTGSSE